MKLRRGRCSECVGEEKREYYQMCDDAILYSTSLTLTHDVYHRRNLHVHPWDQWVPDLQSLKQILAYHREKFTVFELREGLQGY